jgi:hypothetical protein
MSTIDGVSATTTDTGGLSAATAGFDFGVDFAAAGGFGASVDFAAAFGFSGAAAAGAVTVGAATVGAAALRGVAAFGAAGAFAATASVGVAGAFAGFASAVVSVVSFGSVASAFGAATVGAATLGAAILGSVTFGAGAFGATARVAARPSFGAFVPFAGAAARLASTSGATGACGSSSGGAGGVCDREAGALAAFFPRSIGFAPGNDGTSPSMGVRSPEYFEANSRVVCDVCLAALDEARFDSSENCFTSSEARFNSSENREGVDAGRSVGRWGGAFFAIELLFFHEPTASVAAGINRQSPAVSRRHPMATWQSRRTQASTHDSPHGHRIP